MLRAAIFVSNEIIAVGKWGRKREGLATVATSLQLEFKAIVVDYGFKIADMDKLFTSCYFYKTLS